MRRFIIVISMLSIFSLVGCSNSAQSQSSNDQIVGNLTEEQDEIESKDDSGTSKDDSGTSEDEGPKYDYYEATRKRSWEGNSTTYVDDYYVYDEKGNTEYEIEIYGGFNKGNKQYSLSHYTYNKDGQPIIIQFDEFFDMDKSYEKVSPDAYYPSYWFYAYDSNGNLIYEGLPGEHHTDYYYNSSNQLVKQISYGKSNVYGTYEEVFRSSTEYEYDSEGRELKEVTTDKDGQTTTCSYEYDSNGWVTRYGSIYYDYDSEGRTVHSHNTLDKTDTTYTYVEDPLETREYLEVVKDVFDIYSIENKAKGLLMEYDSFLNQIGASTMNHQVGESNSENTGVGELYIGDESEDGSQIDNNNSVWNLDGAHEGSLPDDIFEKIKGKYYSEVNGLEITISSPSQVILDGGTPQTEYIAGCDTDGDKLLVYITYNKEDDGLILSVYQGRTGELCMSTMEGGGWDYDRTHEHAALGRVSRDVKSGYIIPDSSERLLTESDLQGLSKEELRRARNEIAARHGRRFKDPDLQAYFDAQSWYYGDIDPDDFNKIVKLSDIEQKNMEFIQKHE